MEYEVDEEEDDDGGVGGMTTTAVARIVRVHEIVDDVPLGSSSCPIMNI